MSTRKSAKTDQQMPDTIEELVDGERESIKGKQLTEQMIEDVKYAMAKNAELPGNSPARLNLSKLHRFLKDKRGYTGGRERLLTNIREVIGRPWS